jgi:hydroxymethylglutaryl-CoA reductase
MLADPIVRAIMAADGVRAGELEMLVRSAAKHLRATGAKDKGGHVEDEAVE